MSHTLYNGYTMIKGDEMKADRLNREYQIVENVEINVEWDDEFEFLGIGDKTGVIRIDGELYQISESDYLELEAEYQRLV